MNQYSGNLGDLYQIKIFDKAKDGKKKCFTILKCIIPNKLILYFENSFIPYVAM